MKMRFSTGELMKSIDPENIGIKLTPEMLEKVHEVLLSIAEDVISLCEEEHIWYQLGGGTALGAVRHGGFIPWDDDVDINILSKDFTVFKDLLNEKYGDKYWFHCYKTPSYGQPMGRVVLKNSVYRDRESYNSNQCGFFIDIFPLENVPDNKIVRLVHGALCMAFGGILSCRKFYENRNIYKQFADLNLELAEVVKRKIRIGHISSFLPLEKWGTLTKWIYGLCKNEESLYVSFPSGRKHYFGEMYLRDGMTNTILMPFEGHMWHVPRDYGNYFTVLYGEDYMIPPEEEEREHHILMEIIFPEDYEFKDTENNINGLEQK